MHRIASSSILRTPWFHTLLFQDNDKKQKSHLLEELENLELRRDLTWDFVRCKSNAILKHLDQKIEKC